MERPLMFARWRLTVAKMTVAPVLIYGFDRVSTKIPAGFLADIDKLMLKFIRNARHLERSNPPWQRRTKLDDLLFLTSKPTTKSLYSRQWYKRTEGNEDQWDGTESPEINPPLYGQLICHTDAGAIQRGREQASADGAAQPNSHLPKSKAGSLPYTFHEASSKWATDLSIRPTTIQFWEEGIVNHCELTSETLS